ncbi:1,6-anhydro-N-acetylmuramyl-L-alanine amidase AmpD [Ideonella sp.]|uniref:1,6-anhydro-N-acetylmuramyl-L-alanine amidase AmpD n=1 Tax=Ideonella sp. TaxID=1929293 RepID=UPI0037BE5500
MNHTEWHQGWWAKARRLDSPNFGPRPEGMAVSLAVIHSISLPPGVFGGGEVEALFTNQLDWDAHPYFQGIRGLEVSAHFFIRRDGECVQFVSTHDRAWHAGRSCWAGRENCNDYSVGIELEGLEGGRFESVQLHSLVKVLRAVAQIHTLDAVVGHEHVAPGRKADPGPGFDWAWLRHHLAWPEVTIAAGEADQR